MLIGKCSSAPVLLHHSPHLSMLEKEIQKVILDYLRVRHYFFFRNNTGAFKNKDGHFYRFGDLGSPDIFVVRKGQIYGIEVKNAKGKQSEHQKNWQENFEKEGGVYILANGLDDVLKFL